MTPERWQRVEELFRTVADRPVVERKAYLTRVCGDDSELVDEVLSLLAQDTAEDVFQAPIVGAALSLTAEKDELADERVGPYRILRLIGRGGMGTVYEAVRDDEQFQQQVALKLIKRGMDSDFVRDRFLRERQILASLDHPHIARLFDGGTTADGQPYFVMEFVDGIPITDYCYNRGLSLDDRLKLFRDVCSAVQHAHQKLVVHRDLKPSNILVTEDGTPKLLDFGIAKLLTPDPGQAVTRTETALRLMTPDYASPEQVRGDSITTATDIYSLGAVLYELLTKRRPHQFQTYSPIGIERAICETEAPPPSDAARQQTDAPTRLARQLTGDLDNIVLMALRKEPARRYQSVEQFSEDIRRYLAGLPVIARKDTFGYRAEKFIRRHKVGVASILLLAILAVSLAILAVRFARERQRAERRFAQVRALANIFLFDFHDKIQFVPGTTEARAMVAKTALNYLDSLAQEAAGDPQLEWELAVAYQKVGDVQGDPWAPNLGYSHDAMQSYQKSLALAQQLNRNGSNDLKMARLLAQGYFKLGMLQAQSGGKAAAHDTLSQALIAAEKLEQQTHELQDITLLQNCYIRLSDTYIDTGDPVSALEGYKHELRLAERRATEFPGDGAIYTLAMSSSSCARSDDFAGRCLRSSSLLPKVAGSVGTVAFPATCGTKIPACAHDFHNLAGNIAGNPRFINQGDTQAALQYYRQALALAKQICAIDPKNARALQDLAGGNRLVAEILALDQPAKAVEQYKEALNIVLELLKLDPKEAQLLRRKGQYLRGLGDALHRLGDRQAALQNLQQARQVWQELWERDTSNLKTRAELHATLLILANTLLDSGDHVSAFENYQQALTLAETPSVEQSADMYVRWRLADSYSGLSRYYATRANAAPIADRAKLWHDARQYAQQSLSLWEGWPQHAASTNFDRRQREQAAQALAVCNAVLANLEH